jgi:hypothetical protein
MVIKFSGGRHAYLRLKGSHILRPVTPEDLLDSDWGRPLVLIQKRLSRRTDLRVSGAGFECLPSSTECDGTAKVPCSCVCQRCEEHDVACIECDNCTDATVAND